MVRPLRRLLAILATLILMVSAFGGVKAAWMCEGRVCSPDLAKCCCASAAEIRDRECSATMTSGAKGACEGKCGCKAVTTGISSAHPAMPSGPAMAALEAVPFFTLPPTILVLQAFVLREAPQLRPMPPPDGARASVCVERASLRAPPAATS